MKILGFILLLISMVACDPYGFGFKKNPAFVLDEAFKAINNLDKVTFLEVTGKEALCVYGNEAGISYLKERINFAPETVKLNHTVVEKEHFEAAKFVGFWSYYHERYEVQILDKEKDEVLLKTIVDCEYGTDGEKNVDLSMQDPTKYERKECRAIKLVPKKFAALPVPEKCNALKVNL